MTNMTKFVCGAFLTIGILVALSSQPVNGKPRVREIVKYYNIQGVSAAQLKAQMKRKGPKGFWAYTQWWVNWSGSCQLSVKLTYTFPKWVNNSKAPKSLRASWKRMIKKLWIHERGHGQNGINAAREIEKARCSNPMKIIRKYNSQDKKFDLRTRHGRAQGVKLP